jgi:hypothetical protein
MATIAVDIDSTLYDFEAPSRQAMWKLYKETGEEIYQRAHYHPWTEWRSPADVLGLEKWLEVIAMVHDSDVILSRQPYEGAVETCQALMEDGHTLLYISNRATESASATNQWLDDHQFLNCYGLKNEPKVLCTTEDKAPHMAQCQYLIDDRPKTVIEFVYDYNWKAAHVERNPESGLTHLPQRKAFIYGYQYNQALTDVPHIYVALDWYGIAHYLQKHGVLSTPISEPLSV